MFCRRGPVSQKARTIGVELFQKRMPDFHFMESVYLSILDYRCGPPRSIPDLPM